MTTQWNEPTTTSTASDAPPRRVHLAWQVWFDGELRRPPLPLADGAVVLVEHKDHSEVRRVDESGAIVWQRSLEGRASGDPARTLGFLVVPCDGDRVIALSLADGTPVGRPLAVMGLVLRGGVGALRGHVVARFSGGSDGGDPFLAIADLEHPDAPPRLRADPLQNAIETRYRATNHTFVIAGEDATGFAVIAALDAATLDLLWLHRAEGCGLTHLWAAGGLLDVVLTDRVTSFDARSGTQLTTRFEGMVLEVARIAGESLVVTLGTEGPPEDRVLLAHDAMTELPTGDHRGLQRVIGACSDELMVNAVDDRPLLLELPNLVPVAIRDRDNIVSPTMVAWSRHRAYVVGHDGHSLSAVDL